MHGRLKRREIRKRASIKGWTVTAIFAVLGFLVLVASDSRGIPRKWVTALFGTLIPFCFIIYAFRQRLLRWSFWASLAICLAVHVLGIWMFFEYVLANVQTLSILLWFPVMLVEALALLIVVKRIEEKLTGKHETIKLSL
jgi:hypothetical protein